ncbi:MAG: 2-oxo acid dehydrogenase subunit E2 [Pseudomonadales bacterium]|nr:2-oxo acid dehydrogenase subunit E2 [Pseudomonadales bacterium]
MKYFKLPDLGEGLQEAEIVEWHVKLGGSIKTDELMVSVETAKAIVEVPSPQDGVIHTLFGSEGDIIHVGEPLVEFAGEEQEDTGTVVGKVETHHGSGISDDDFIIGSSSGRTHASKRCTPAVRALAKRMNIELNTIQSSGEHGLITAEDVEHAAQLNDEKGALIKLRGVRRSMARNMTRAHEEVAQVTIFDDVDVHDWVENNDPTMRIVRAIGVASKAEPLLNAWYDGKTMTLRPLKSVDLGIAVDTPDGLFVPVLRDIGNRSMENLREGLDRLRVDVKARTIPPSELINPSITLSNFGTTVGKYANPVVVPPTVCILGSGAIREVVAAVDGHAKVRRIMPISLSFDHRPVTGGEAARFLSAFQEDLKLPQ